MEMSKFTDKLQLKGMAEEDIYFAKRDVELIDALHRGKLAKVAKCGDEGAKAKAEVFEDRFKEISKKNKKKPRRLLRAYRALIDEIKEHCKRRK